MNHAGEIRPLTKMVRPQGGDRHDGGGGAPWRISPARRRSPRPRRRSSTASSRGRARRCSTATIAGSSCWPSAPPPAAPASFPSGEHAAADVRLVRAVLQEEEGSSVQAEVAGEPVTYRLGAPGRHLVQNSLAVIGAVHAAGADLARAMLGLAQFPRAQGARRALRAGASRPGRSRCSTRATTPTRPPCAPPSRCSASWPRAAAAAASPCSATCWSSATRPRRSTATWPRRSTRPASTWCFSPAR